MINGEFFNANDIVGKFLFTSGKKNVYICKIPNTDFILKVIHEPGFNIGKVIDYVIGENRQLFWLVDGQNNIISQETQQPKFYVLHQAGLFDIKAIIDQGAKTVLTKKKEREPINILELLKNAGILLGVITAIITITKFYKK